MFILSYTFVVTNLSKPTYWVYVYMVSVDLSVGVGLEERPDLPLISVSVGLEERPNLSLVLAIITPCAECVTECVAERAMAHQRTLA